MRRTNSAMRFVRLKTCKPFGLHSVSLPPHPGTLRRACFEPWRLGESAEPGIGELASEQAATAASAPPEGFVTLWDANLLCKTCGKSFLAGSIIDC